MKLPKSSKVVLTFKHKDKWYKITSEKDKYILYGCGQSESDYEMLATGNTPPKLEDKVYSGKVK